MSNPYQTPDPYGGGGGFGPPQQPGYGAPQPPQYPQAPQQPGYGYPQQAPPPVQAYGYPQQPPVPQQPFVPQAPVAEPNSVATASLALGFASIVICFYGAILGPIGLGLGIAGLNRAQKTGVGRSQAIGGVALSTLGVLIGIAGLVFYQTVKDKLVP